MKKFSLILTAISLFLVMTISGAFAQDGAPEKTRVYRFYNRVTGEHLYTADNNEAYTFNTMVNSPWDLEGVSFVSEEGGRPVWRLYNPESHEHLYTADENEVNVLISAFGWQADNGGNPSFYVMKEQQEGVTDTRPALAVHRLYNPNAPLVSCHLLTSDENEISVLKSHGYVDEGVKFTSLDPEAYGLTLV